MDECEHSEAVGVDFSSGDSGSVSPSLMQVFLSTVCRLLFLHGESA